MKIVDHFGSHSSISGEYYVYIYYDPDTKEPFYVGKGKKNRLYDHIKEAKSNKTKKLSNRYKINKIRKILNSDNIPIIKREIIFITEERAFEIEELLINIFKDQLTNIAINSFSSDTISRNPNKEAIIKKISETLKKGYATGKYSKFWKCKTGKDHPAFGAKHRKDAIKKRTIKFKKTIRKRGLNKGKLNPRFGDHRSYDEIYGVEKSAEIRKKFSNQRKGSGNFRSIKCKYINDKKNITVIYDCINDFCNEFNISRFKIGQLVRKEIAEYEGWTATKITNGRSS